MSKGFYSSLDHQLISMISASSTRKGMKSVTSAGVVFGWNEIIHTPGTPRHMIAQPCSTLTSNED